MIKAQLAKVDIVFENCEVITLWGEYIKHMNIGQLHISISYCKNPSDLIDETWMADHIELIISKEANKKYKSFGIGKEITVFDRILAYKDITHIDVFYKHEDMGMENKYIGVAWENYDKDDNLYQQVNIDKNGDMIIKIHNNITN